MEKKHDVSAAVIERLVKDRRARTQATRESHLLFFATYFTRYMTSAPAAFHREMFALTERKDIRLLIVEAFRGSGKSTIMTTSFPIWSVLGKPQKKFVLLLGRTERQAKQHFMNLKKELEGNGLLRDDLGPFETEQDEWGSSSIVLTKYGARISFASIEQPVRGLRHGPHRPDLVIGDDLEDPDSARSKEWRDKLHRWFSGDVLPIGAEKTMFVLVGNLVHEDGLLSRLEGAIEQKRMVGVFRKYPLLDDKGRCLWPERYQTRKAVADLKMGTENEAAWSREYLLRIIADEERVIKREWIRYYDGVPDFGGKDFLFGVTAVDLAISEKRSADFTAMVSAAVFKDGKGGRRIYILPRPINSRMDFPKSLACAKNVSWSVIPNKRTELVVESVAFQAAYVQELKRQGFNVHPYEVSGRDKRSRLALTSAHVESGTVLFPREGSKELINQLVNFGIEKHDDLADAFSMCVDYAMTRKYVTFGIYYLGRRDPPQPKYSMDDVFRGWR